MVQASRLCTFTYDFEELVRLAACPANQERNLLRLMPGAGETLCREAAARGIRQIPGASESHLMHAQVYHRVASAGCY